MVSFPLKEICESLNKGGIMGTKLIKVKSDGETTFEYIGYTEMLDKITSLMDKVSYENKFILIDKYIEILKFSKVNNENN